MLEEGWLHNERILFPHLVRRAGCGGWECRSADFCRSGCGGGSQDGPSAVNGSLMSANGDGGLSGCLFSCRRTTVVRLGFIEVRMLCVTRSSSQLGYIPPCGWPASHMSC